jgi:hypothetical protein
MLFRIDFSSAAVCDDFLCDWALLCSSFLLLMQENDDQWTCAHALHADDHPPSTDFSFRSAMIFQLNSFLHLASHIRQSTKIPLERVKALEAAVSRLRGPVPAQPGLETHEVRFHI